MIPHPGTMNIKSPIRIMGIVNITDNSYYAQSRCLGADGTADIALVRERIATMLREGADIIDIGACSTRPGAPAVGADVELSRLAPVLEMIGEEFPLITVSVDTYWASVATLAASILPDFASSGRLIINDIYAGRRDPSMLETVGRLKLPYIAMHSLEETLDSSDYGGDVVEGVRRYFEEFSAKASEAGIEEWVLDPGFGFGKSVAQNWELLDRMRELSCFGKEILVGISRKSMIYKPLGITPEDALPATQAAHLAALDRGATILRVHDVAPTKGTIDVWRMIHNY